jgi:hypothetical protein
MCDYSLHAVATRPAEVAETLVSTKFQTAGTRGFASPNSPKVAVCLRPGTELAFEHDVQTGGMMFRKSIGARLARFRQIDTENLTNITTLSNSRTARSFLLLISLRDKGLRYCNCLRAPPRKSLGRPDLQLGRPLLIKAADIAGTFTLPARPVDRSFRRYIANGLICVRCGMAPQLAPEPGGFLGRSPPKFP